jgi:hypothetical protein
LFFSILLYMYSALYLVYCRHFAQFHVSKNFKQLNFVLEIYWCCIFNLLRMQPLSWVTQLHFLHCP